MTKTKEDVDKEFGEVVTRRCSFCNKTYDAEKFYDIPDTDGSYSFIKSSLNITGNLFSSNNKAPKEVNEGICLKCMLKGIGKICGNDMDKVKECFSLYFKKEIVGALDSK